MGCHNKKLSLRTKLELMQDYDLSTEAPLVLLFDQPLADLRHQLQLLVDDSSDLAIEMSSDQSFLSATVQQGSVGFDVIWSEAQPVLSGYRSVFLGTFAPEKSVLLSVNLTQDLAGGESVAPIVKALLVFGARVARQLSAQAVMWTPAKIISAPAFFAENVGNYAKGEIFPVLVTVDFDYADEERTLRTSGLAWFSGQEIELSGGGLHGQDLVRRAVRLVHDIGTNGAVVAHQQVPDLDADKVIDMVLQPDSNVLRCEISSKTDDAVRVSSVH
jgi:hypothetical protein